VHYSKGRFARAEEYLRQSIALNPTFPDPYVILGQIELKAGRRGDALNSTRRATELNPFNAQYHEIYGIMLASNGNCPDAMTQFKSAEVLEPGDFIVQREMFRCGSTANPGTTPITPSAQR
jgi:type IV pilus assembly protein PilF